MQSTYAQNAAICAKFYELILESDEVGKFVFEHSRAQADERGLFVGGMFGIADHLLSRGIDLTVVDYTDEMVDLAKSRLPGVRVEKADLRFLPYKNEFDVVFVVGRVFTHMISDEDLRRALRACRDSLRPGGRLFCDNYEDSKIGRTSWFNSKLRCSDADCEITRVSTTEVVSASPHVVRWNANYRGKFDGEAFEFSDSMEHRAWSRGEILPFLAETGFEVLSQGDNFDETSFYTLARRGTSAAIT